MFEDLGMIERWKIPKEVLVRCVSRRMNLCDGVLDKGVGSTVVAQSSSVCRFEGANPIISVIILTIIRQYSLSLRRIIVLV